LTYVEGEDGIGVDGAGGLKEGLPVIVAVASVLIHTGAFVTVKVTPGVIVSIVFVRIDVWISMGARVTVTSAGH
jgi:hypothetical protein